MQQAPTAKEFLRTFLEAYTECLGEANEADEVWTNWTAFMTGKQGKSDGHYEKKPVLGRMAEKLGLKHEREDLALDMVLYRPGHRWGNLVAIEHENAIDGFEREIEKLMSVLAPLKVGITYDYREVPGKHSELAQQIQTYFNTRNPSILESPKSEYLFLLGVGRAADTMTWKYFAFACGEGPGSEFRDADEGIRAAGAS